MHGWSAPGRRPRPDGGLLVSEPVHVGIGKPSLDAEVALEGWGRVTALSTFGAGREHLLAVGGEGRATACGAGRRAVSGEGCSRLTCPSGPPPSHGTVGCCGRSAASSRRPRSTTIGGRTCGGAVMPASIPRTVGWSSAGALPDEVAWGNGGVAVVMASAGSVQWGGPGACTGWPMPATGRFDLHRPPRRVLAWHRPRGRRR